MKDFSTRIAAPRIDAIIVEITNPIDNVVVAMPKDAEDAF